MVIVTLPTSGSTIYTSLVGDSGFSILRRDSEKKYRLQYQSKSQQYRFNFPFQLGWKQNGDGPRIAANEKHEVQQDDIVLVATDGVLDNLEPIDVGSSDGRWRP